MHGGSTPRGTESPHFKHGLYSRYAAPALAARIDELRQDEARLHDLREVLAVQGALLGEALQQDDLGAAVALTEAVSRSIDRFHKQNKVYAADGPAQLTEEQIDVRIDELLLILDREGTGNP